MLFKILWNALEKWFFSRMRLLIDIFQILFIDFKMTQDQKDLCQFDFNFRYFLRYVIGLIILVPLEFYIPSLALDMFYTKGTMKYFLLFAYIILSVSFTMWLTAGMIEQMHHYKSIKRSTCNESRIKCD